MVGMANNATVARSVRIGVLVAQLREQASMFANDELKRTVLIDWRDHAAAQSGEALADTVERKAAAARIACDCIFAAHEIEVFMLRTGLGERETREACLAATASAIRLT
jgi:hypothetical protein